MATLTDVTKNYIVRSLACFNTPSDVVELLKEEFEITLDRAQVAKYDPTKPAGEKLGAKYKALFEETRKKFLNDFSQIPLANAAVRIAELAKMAMEARKRKNNVLAAQHLEQIAKEVGGTFTNKINVNGKHELTGANGGPIHNKTTVDLSKLNNEQLKAIASIPINDQ